MQIPTPGNITNPNGVPAELRAINQWIMWKPVVRGKKLTKVPVSWMNPLGDNINAHDPSYWGTFDQVVQEMQDDPRFGIGLVLDGTGLICLDHDDHADDDREAVKLGSEYMGHLQTSYPTYVERSLQGAGTHAFYRGTLPHGRVGGIIDQLNLEIYAAQFIAITGNAVIGSHSAIADGQPIVDSWKLPPPVAATQLGPTEALGRSLNLSDADVISTMIVRRRSIFNMMNSQADLGDRSTAYAQIIGDLDKITGDPAQIDRIIRKCPFFKNAYNSSKYDQTPKWLHKSQCSSMLDYWLKQARTNNTESIQYAEFITQERREFLESVVAVFERERLEREQHAHTDMIAAAAKPADVAHSVKADSSVAKLLFEIQDSVGGSFDDLSIPPGAVGRFVESLAPMLTDPRLTFALPAVISTLSGYLGQTFKAPGFGMGLVNHFIIAGQMNTGKTSTMSVFNSAIDQALSGRYRDPANPTKLLREDTSTFQQAHRRIIETRAASAQGVFEPISGLGSAVWFADEAESQLELMSSGTPVGLALKAFYKQTFDKATAYATTSLDASRASSREGVVPIINMNMPTYWSCTSEVFEKVSVKEILDGTMSRVNLVYDEQPPSLRKKSSLHLHHGLPRELAELMRKIAFIADTTAAAYNQQELMTIRKDMQGSKASKTAEDMRTAIERNKEAGAAMTIHLRFTREAEQLHERIETFCQRLGYEANPTIGEWPYHYQLMSRVDMMTTLVAGLLAACDTLDAWQMPPIDNLQSNWRETLPQARIHTQHLQWAFEFVMHWRLRLFAAWDQGKISVQMSDAETRLLDKIQDLLKKGKHCLVYEGTVWVAEHYLITCARQVSPFKDADDAGRRVGRSSTAIMIRDTLVQLHKDDRIVRATADQLGLAGKGGYVSLVFR